MSKYWSNTVKTLKPYIPGEQPKEGICIKLNTNENPYPPSPLVLEAIKNSADSRLRLYPDPECSDLRTAIAGYHNVTKEEIFVGNGSDELLAFCFLAFFEPGKHILFPDITYSFYKVYSQMFRINYHLVPLDEHLNINVNTYFQANGGIIFPNPNAPTGKHLPVDSIRKLLEYNNESVVIVDEAYIDFGGDTALEFIRDYPNLLVIRTFSKSRSLAGLRVGYALGNEELIEGLHKVKNSINSYTLDRIAIYAAEASIKDERYFQECSLKIIATRERIAEKLRAMGVEVLESKANFIFISAPAIHASLLVKKLREKGVLVRYFNQPRIDNYLRVTVGTDSEMDYFMKSLSAILVSK